MVPLIFMVSSLGIFCGTSKTYENKTRFWLLMSTTKSALLTLLLVTSIIAGMQEKQESVKRIFQTCTSADERYRKLMELGRTLPPFQEAWKTPDKIVEGCQSIVYLHSEFKEGKIFFYASAEALISAGLAALLIMVYSGESPETVLKCPPTFIEELGLHTSLSPGRSNGLLSMHLRMKQEALQSFTRKRQ